MRFVVAIQRRGRRWACVLMTTVVLMGALAVASPSGAVNTSWGDAQPALFASGVQNGTPNGDFNSVSCSGLTCVAAGDFTNAQGQTQGVTETSSDGGVTWDLAHPVTFAAGVLNSTNPESAFDSVSCSGLDCVAVGYYYPPGDSFAAMTDTSSDGGQTWTDAQPVNFANGVQNSTMSDSNLFSVSCSGTTCVASGYFYGVITDVYQGMTVNSSDGGLTWETAQPVVLANGLQNPAAPFSELADVSCSGLTCVAVGFYYDPDHIYRSMTATSTNGGVTWADAQATTFPTGMLDASAPYNELESVSCSGMTCVAAGGYQNDQLYNSSMTVTSTNGGVTWANAQSDTFASGAQNVSQNSLFDTISCSGLNCVVAGQFEDASGDYQAATETSVDGGVTWANVQPASFAVGVENSSPNATFSSVSCSGTTCVAAGNYSDISGGFPAVTETSTDGGVTWANAQPASFAPGVQSSTPEAVFTSVSCSASACAAAGFFSDAANDNEAMTASDLQSSDTITNLDVTQTGSTLSASWSPVDGATSYTCTLLYGFNTPSNFTTTTTGPSCSFSGLSATTPYGVAVVANDPSGASAPTSAFGTPTTTTTTTTTPKAPRPVVRTIVCVRDKKLKRIRGVRPRCPAGYKLR